MKIRLQFEKNIKYISHLDLMKAVQKILKRTGYPLKYSEGFNPHMVLSIANPLPLGIVGKQEFLDFELKTDSISFGELKEKLTLASPKGIVPVEIYTEDGTLVKKLKNFNLTTNADYDIAIRTSQGNQICNFLARETIPVEKFSKGKIKIIDLKELIFRYEITDTKDGVQLLLNCACGNEKNLNPLLLKKAMQTAGIEITAFSPVRLGFYDAEGNGFSA
ncbi:MAG: DUF2344 domain-containing protein [Clostridia bacterium]|nr:DUF2344 domain-containing protein [Clostridia bacterium]